MSDNKTQPSAGGVKAFIDSIESVQRRKDARALLKMMREITGEKAVLWGPSIIGFGRYHYRYASGREGDWFLTGFSPRKQNFSLYIMAGFRAFDGLMKKLGKHKTGKSCLYINKLEDVNQDVLRDLISQSVAWMRKQYPDS